MKAKKVLALMLAAVMLMCASVAATVAYLKDDDSVVNTFTVGKVFINLDEFDYDNDDNEEDNVTVNGEVRDKANKYHLLPGQTYRKDPTVTVLKDSDECYVRMLVTFSYSRELDAIFAPNGANLESIFTELGTANWDLHGVTESENNNTRTYEFRYKNTVAKNTTGNTELTPLFKGFKVPEGLTNEQLATLVTVNAETGEITDQMEITVVAHAIQAAGFTDTVVDGKTIPAVDNAWDAFE